MIEYQYWNFLYQGNDGSFGRGVGGGAFRSIFGPKNFATQKQMIFSSASGKGVGK